MAAGHHTKRARVGGGKKGRHCKPQPGSRRGIRIWEHSFDTVKGEGEKAGEAHGREERKKEARQTLNAKDRKETNTMYKQGQGSDMITQNVIRKSESISLLH